jgi:hypothetical protein
MYRKLLFATAAVVSLHGCAGLGSFGGTAQIATKLCGVRIDNKAGETHLQIVLAVSKLPRNGLLEVDFENPGNEKAPLVVTRRLSGNERTIEVLSPAVPKLQPRSYMVTTRVYATPDRKQLVATHVQRCEALANERDVLP